MAGSLWGEGSELFTPTDWRRMSHFFVRGWLGEWTHSPGWAVHGSGAPGVDPHLSYGGTLPNAQVVDPTRSMAAAEHAGEGLNFDS
jgi:hypothetical protein